MAKIKHTKNELKAQKEALKRFTRFLPMLQLKKQQLQIEIQQIDARLAAVAEEEARCRADLERWLGLFAEPVKWEEWLAVEEVEISTGNIAGVNIPVLERIRLRRPDLDLFATPTWADEAQELLAKLLELKVRRRTLEEQRRLIAEELRTTSQRVNLFEKVKIPECRENIRVISIFLGDEQTAAVARGKIAKSRQSQ
ncbi:MAG: V-type ATP synthase subunit D [Planctomycetota bacterium]|nr:V-type ATP synthase subunit D [Planctomycetota bacterium]